MSNLNYIDWLEESIKNEHIRFYEYSNFKNPKRIGQGAFGSVHRANWKSNTDRFFALKSFNNDKQTLIEVIKEVQYLKI